MEQNSNSYSNSASKSNGKTGAKPLPNPPQSTTTQAVGQVHHQLQRKSHDPADGSGQLHLQHSARPGLGQRRVSEADSHTSRMANMNITNNFNNVNGMPLGMGTGLAGGTITESPVPMSASSAASSTISTNHQMYNYNQKQNHIYCQHQQPLYYERHTGSHYSSALPSASSTTTVPSSNQQQQLQYYPPHQPQQVYYQQQHIPQQHKHFIDNTDTVSVHSAAASSAPSASATIPHENLEAYRMEVKASKDPIKQFEFAKQLVIVAEEMRKNPQGLDPQKIRKNRDILHHEALKWIKKAASASYKGKTGVPDALFYLADCYGNGNLGLTIDHDRAFGYYTQGAKQDHPASIYRTGVCYEVGAGPKKDHGRAVQFYRKAAALGDPAALFKVGMILLEGTLGQPKNGKEAVNLLKRAAGLADESTPYALHELAILYEGVNLDPSTGIVPDPIYSFELFLKAAKLGYAPSQYKLGMSHEYGHLGLAVDAKRAIAWYTKAAQQGEADAELALSGWYLIGHEPLIPQSNKEAFLWAKKAGNKGLSKAEYAMGYFMEHGIGTTQNLEEARKWYIRAAGQGNARAIARLSDKGSSSKAKGGVESSLKPSDWKKSKEAQKGECVLM